MGVVIIRHACSFECFLFIFPGLISTSMVCVTPCKLILRETIHLSKRENVFDVRGSLMDQSLYVTASLLLVFIYVAAHLYCAVTATACYLSVTAVLLVNYCSVNNLLLFYTFAAL